MRIGPAANVARLNVAETISALWTFENVLGLLTDIIGERTGGAGVTIDGVQLRDRAVGLLGLASAANRILGSDVVGDVDERFRLHAGGIMQWGDGAGARDTNLFRQDAGVLRTDDHLEIVGELRPLTNLILTPRTITIAATPANNVATASSVVQLINTTVGGPFVITGFSNPVDSRFILVYNIDATETLTLNHQDGASSAANRLILPNLANMVILRGEGAVGFYDGVQNSWRLGHL